MEKEMEALGYEYWFASTNAINGKKKIELRNEGALVKELYYMEETRWKQFPFLKEEEIKRMIRAKQSWDFEKETNKFIKSNSSCIYWSHPEYPEKLRHIPSPPYALYVKGRLPDSSVPSIGIVGSRVHSSYGERYAREFASTLSEAGVQIISGMARGIDGISQRTAINNGGTSYGVLASGVDVCYPKEHFGLYMDLQNHGGVISEQALGVAPFASYFPARNRIISGLSDAILVIEAKEKSGSLITADMALEQGVDVYALPGDVDSVLSRGCNQLIRQGAGILLSPKELLEELQIFYSKKVKKRMDSKSQLTDTESLVYECLQTRSKSSNSLANELAISIPKLLDALISLELKGIIKEISQNQYIRITN